MPDIFDLAESPADAGGGDIFDQAAGDLFDQAAANVPVSTARGLTASLQRGVKQLVNLPTVVQAAGVEGLDQPSFRQRRRAYEAAMSDPDYMGRMGRAESPEQARKIESLFGPAAKLDAAMRPQRGLQQGIAEDVAKLQEEMAALPQSAAQQRLASATSGKEKWNAWLKDPFELTASIVLESLPPALAGAAVGGVGGSMALGVGASSGVTTFANEFLNNAQALGYDVKDPDRLRAFLNSEEDFNAAFKPAAVKASIIGKVDAATAGLAGQFIEPALKSGLKQVLIAGGKEMGLQAAGGSGGELVGSLAAGQKPDLFDVAMEGIAEIATGPAEAIGNIQQSRQTSPPQRAENTPLAQPDGLEKQPSAKRSPVPVTRDLAAELQAAMQGNQVAPKVSIDTASEKSAETPADRAVAELTAKPPWLKTPPRTELAGEYTFLDAVNDSGGLGGPDLESALAEIESGRTPAQVAAQYGQEYDGLGDILEEIYEARRKGKNSARFNQLAKAYELARLGGNRKGVDQALNNIREAAQQGMSARGGTPADPSELISRAWAEALAKAEGKLDESSEAQAERFWQMALQPGSTAGLRKVNLSELKAGATFRLRGKGVSHEELRVTHVDEDGTVQVKDGPAFGTQDLPADTEVWLQELSAEPVPRAKPDEAFWKAASTGKQKVRATDLLPGDVLVFGEERMEVTGRDDNGEVTLQGKKFGQQYLQPENVITADAHELGPEHDGRETPAPAIAEKKAAVAKAFEDADRRRAEAKAREEAAMSEPLPESEAPQPDAPEEMRETPGKGVYDQPAPKPAALRENPTAGNLDRNARHFYGRPYDELAPEEQDEIRKAVIDERLPKVGKVFGSETAESTGRQQAASAGETPGEPASPVQPARSRAEVKEQREQLAQEIFRKPYANLFEGSRAHVRDELKRGRVPAEVIPDEAGQQFRQMLDERARLQESLRYGSFKNDGGGWSPSDPHSVGLLAQIRYLDGKIDLLRELANAPGKRKGEWLKRLMEGDKPESRDRIIDALNSLKVDTKGQLHAFGLLPELWNQLIDLVKLAVRGGRSLRDAIGVAIEQFKAQHPDANLDEEAATDYLLNAEDPEAAKLREQFADERDAGRKQGVSDTAKKPWQEVEKEVKQASDELMQKIRERANPALRGPDVTAAQARQAVSVATARFRRLKDALVRHPDYVTHLLRRMKEVARATGDQSLTREQRIEAQMEFENLQGELEQVPERLALKIGDEMIKRGELESRADRARAGIEQPSPSRSAPRAEPVGPVLEEFSLAERLKELPARARELFSGLRRVKDSLMTLAKRSANRNTMAYTKDAADNTAAITGKQAANFILHELNRAFGAGLNDRNQLREWALTFVIEAGITREGIEQARQTIIESQHGRRQWAQRALRALDYADAHFARLQPVAELYQKITDAEVAVENEAGIDTIHRAGGYVFHTQDVDAEWGNISFGMDPGGPTAPFKHVRDYNTYADALAAGVTPRTLNAVDLLQRRMTLGRKLVNYRAWLDNLRSVSDQKTDLPLVTDTVKRQRKDGSVDEIPPGGYTIQSIGGQRIAVLKGYEGIFISLTSPSYWRSGTVKPFLLNLAGTTKHILLVFDTFHLGRLAFWQVMTRRGLPGYQRGLTLLDTTRSDLETMIARDEIPAEWGEALLERKAELDALLAAGLNVAGISDNVFSHWVEHIPVTGHFNTWLFQKFQRGAMCEAALIELARMRKQFPRLPAHVVVRRVARDINTRFGNLGTQGWIKSRTGRDLARLIFLAPQWNESLIRSEVMAVRDILMSPVESYRQGRPAIGTMGLAVGLAALGMFLAGQILNWLTRGKPTWENEEEGLGAKISGYVPDVVGDGPGFFLNPMSLPLEITHLIEKNAEKTGGDYTESLRRFMEGRLNLLSRAAHTFVTRHSFEQGKLRSGSEVMTAIGRDLIPVPLPASSLYRGGKELITGENEEKYPGQFQFQMMQSFGVKTDRVPSAEQRMRALAAEYNREQGIVPAAEFFHGDYYELENALRLGNEREMKRGMTELLQKKTKRQIYDHWTRWARAPFTGQIGREVQFKRTLSEEQRQAYDAARESRREIAKSALKLLRETPAPQKVLTE